MSRSSPKAVRGPLGQTVTEYIVIVALIAIATLGVVGLYGNNLRRLFGGSSKSLAGSDAVANSGSHNTGQLHKTMSNFGQQGSDAASSDSHSTGGSEGGTANAWHPH